MTFSESKLTKLKNFIEEKHCDLGENAWRLFDLVETMENARFLDLGVRLGPSSAIMSFNSKEKNNKVVGCDIDFGGFRMGARSSGYAAGKEFVDDSYEMCVADSVTLGKNWKGEPFDIIFVDTLHTREQVLCELYFWSNHLKPNGYFVFHDSHWDHTEKGDRIADKEWGRVDVAITEFFNLPMNIMKCNGQYQDDDIFINHFPGSYGMSFIQVRTLDAIERFKSGIDWEEVFNIRNELNGLHFDEDNPKSLAWAAKNDTVKGWPNFSIVENELIIKP
jgi:SAM-dependent methyltransferase